MKIIPKILSPLVIAGCLLCVQQSEGEVVGTVTHGTGDCTGATPYTTVTWTDDQVPPNHFVETVYISGCTATYTYTENGNPYRTDTGHVYDDDCPGCGPEPIFGGSGVFGHCPLALSNLNANSFTAVAATNIDHFAVYSLDDGSLVLNSGPVSGNNPSFTISNALFSAGSNYAVTACSSDNTIQGSASFQASTGAISQLIQIESWQEVTNTLPGATIAAVVAPNRVAALLQNANRSVVVGTGAYWPQAYTINVPAGTSFIANHLDHGSNNLADLFPAPTLPDGVTIGIYSQTTCSSNSYYYESDFAQINGTPWATDASGSTPVDPTTVTLPPGAGAYINNPNPAFALTFVGNPHVPVLPAPLPCGFGNLNLMSGQTKAIGTYENITGYSPQPGSQVFIFNGSSFLSYSYGTVGWSPTTPAVPIGVSVYVRVPRTTTCVPPPSNLALWLPFDETGGTISENLAVGGNDGTQVGGPFVASGHVANSLCFNGSSQWVTVPDYPAIDPGANQNFTVDAWVRRAIGAPNSPPSVILDKRDPVSGIGYSLAVSYGNLIFQLADSSGFDNYGSVGAVPADGNWHFVAVSVTRNQTNGGRFYVDGAAGATFDPTGHPGSLATTAPFQVAASMVGGNQPWEGCIDEVEMFGRALAASELQGIYYAGTLGKCKPACVVPPSNLVMWLPFDETSGSTSANAASPANYGSHVNGPGVVFNAAVNNSLSFNGVDQYVTVPDYPALEIGTNDLTIDAWVNRATNGPNSLPCIIVDKRDVNTYVGYSLALSYGNLIFQMSGVNYRDTGTVPPDGRWHFVAVSLSQGAHTASFYIDGALQSVVTVSPADLANTNDLWVGASPLGGNRPWLGDLDEVEVFNRALAASELAAIYKAGKFGKCRSSCATPPSNLALWLPFDETSGSSSANLASPAYYGTQVNGPGVVLNAWVGNSLSFSGAQYVTVPDYPAIEIGTNDLTIDAWVNRATNGPDSLPCIIVDKRDLSTQVGYSLSLSYGNLIFQMSGQNYRGNGVVPPDGRWHFVAVSLSQSAATATFYIDGVADPLPVTPDYLGNTNQLWVGASPLGGNQPWQGYLDEVEVFNRALLTTELAAIYSAGQAGKCKPGCVTPPSNLALWLPFDETNGVTSANLASPANFGTQANGPSVVLNAWVDNSLSFNGAQYVTVPDYPAIEIGTNNLTIDAWVNRPTYGSDSPPSIIVDKRDVSTFVGYSLSLDYGNLIFQMSGANYRGHGVVPADGRWHFIAVSLSQGAATATFYIDGVADPIPVTPAYLGNTSPLWVGASPIGGDQPWQGYLDEVEVFNRALATTELAAIYTAGQAGKCKPPCFNVSCPPAKSVQCGSKWSFDQPTATSCCSTNVNILPLGTETNGVCPKVATRSWLLFDDCGHTNVCSQTVTLVDTTAPVVTCPTNTVIVPLNSKCQMVIPSFRPPATDNCTPASQLVYSQTPPANSIVSSHSQMVTITVRDLCGNSSVCHVLVVGVDKSGPVLSGPSSVTVTNCLVPCVLNLVTATDNCCAQSSLKFTQSPPCNTPLGPGINSVTVTVTDCHGNSTSKVIHLNIIGTESFLGSLTNTGVGISGTLLALGAVDPHYSLGPVPPGTPGYIPPTAVAITNLWGWLELVHVSEWIAPDLNFIQNCPSGSYTYTNQFVLPPGANPSSASISGRWAADDGSSMYFNGVLQGANTIPVLGSPLQQSGFNHWHPFTITGGFLPSPSKNTILFVVSNSINYNPSPTGLRVEYTNALVNCFTCTPPTIVSMTGSESLPLFSLAVFHANAAGTPPLSYQWYHNGVPLSNNGHDSGVTTATLHVFPLTFADAGTYSVVVSNPCGSVTNLTHLRVHFGWPWNWGWWNIGQLDNPLAATVGPDLILAGPTTFGLSAGTTEDFGLPNPGGQIVNVMDVAPLTGGTSIQLPVIAPAGSNTVNSYSVVMDLYEPGAGLGTPSVLFRNGCCIGTNGSDGVELTLDAQNNLHLDGVAAGVPFDVASTTPLPVDAWNRVACIMDDPQDGPYVNLTMFNNGQVLGSLTVPTSTGLPINWNSSAATFLSRQTNDPAINAEFFVASLQFHAAALTPDQIAGSGSPDDGSAAASDTSVGPQPLLSAAVANGTVSLTWSASPYVLQETTDVTSGAWVDSDEAFTEAQVGGSIVTTATAKPGPVNRAKFYRLVFRP